MRYKYCVLGAGRQGLAAAYDLAKFGEAEQVIIADRDRSKACAAAAQVNELVGVEVAEGIELEVTNQEAVFDALREKNAFISAISYSLNLNLTQVAIQIGVNMCDLGGNTEVVWEQLRLDRQAREAGITVIPDCGMGPGMTNSLAAYAMTLLDQPREVYIYDGGLPQDPQPPWNYQLTFNIEGLTNEYYGRALFLRGGKQVEVPCLTEREIVEFPPPLGQLEAFVTAGGASTAVLTYEGQLAVYENKTLRYPGHLAQFKAFFDLGLLELEPIEVNGQEVVPRGVFHALLEPKISAPAIRDICVIRVRAMGKKDGVETAVVIDLVDYYDEKPGFTAMQRLTGWHAAIMAQMAAQGWASRGVVPVERAVPIEAFMVEVRRRGFKVKESMTTI